METLRILASLALGFVFMTAGGLEIVLERELAARRLGRWVCQVPRFVLKLAGLVGVFAGFLIVLPGVVNVPKPLVAGAGAAMILLMAAVAVLHWHRRELLRLAVNLALAALTAIVTGIVVI